MTRYALLILPSANRVYAEAAAGLTAAELAAFSDSVLGGALSAAEVTRRGGVPYLEFEAGPLRPEYCSFLANISSLYALFEVTGELLSPVELTRLDRYDDDLITIQKYQGKTNEQFTKLLLNVTLLASAFAPDMLSRKLTVLDPPCGRGTTMNQALMYGYDAAGLDEDRNDFDAYRAFIKAWLTRKRIKHKVSYDGSVRREGKAAGRWLHVSLAASKDEQKAGPDAGTRRGVRGYRESWRVLPAGQHRRGGDRRAVRRPAREQVGGERAGTPATGLAGSGRTGVGDVATARRRYRHRLEHARGAAC